MVSTTTLRRSFLGRDVAVAFALVAAAYVLRLVPFQPLQVPGYLLILTYDMVEMAVPALTPYWPVGFTAFLYALAVGGAAVTRRTRSPDGSASPWWQAAGGLLVLFGALAAVMAAWIGIPYALSTDAGPLAIIGTTAVLLLGSGVWLLRRD